jgi:hypothetical protein
MDNKNLDSEANDDFSISLAEGLFWACGLCLGVFIITGLVVGSLK